MVFTFIPPPIDCDEHPTHMRNIMIRNIVCDSDDNDSDENPAVRGVAELKKDCTIFLPSGMPAKA